MLRFKHWYYFKLKDLTYIPMPSIWLKLLEEKEKSHTFFFFLLLKMSVFKTQQYIVRKKISLVLSFQIICAPKEKKNKLKIIYKEIFLLFFLINGTSFTVFLFGLCLSKCNACISRCVLYIWILQGFGICKSFQHFTSNSSEF